MTKLETFLSKPISDHKAFSSALNAAIKEVRAEDLRVDTFDLMFNGDHESLTSINKGSIYHTNDSLLPQYLTSIPEHLKQVVNSWETSGIVYRGTRLPDNSGSFDFDGIHTTPHLHIANGYASGSANSSTGIGRLLKDIEGGFITAYEVPLTTSTYSNFEYEDLKKVGIEKSGNTLNDLKNTLLELSIKDGNEFYLDSNDIASPAFDTYNSLVGNKSHYETILPSDSVAQGFYFRNNKDFTKINLDNPKWDKLLARVQEASLRDFYEVVPLEKLLQQTSYIAENAENKEILEKTRNLITSHKNEFINAPWECTSMKDVNLHNSQYIQKRPYIKNSRCVGSAMNTSNVEKPEIIQKLENLVNSIRTNDLGLAKSLLQEVTPVVEVKVEPTLNKESAIQRMLSIQNSLNEKNNRNSVTPKFN